MDNPHQDRRTNRRTNRTNRVRETVRERLTGVPRYWLESNDYPGAAAGVVNGILIAIFNQISRFLAVKLTDMVRAQQPL